MAHDALKYMRERAEARAYAEGLRDGIEAARASDNELRPTEVVVRVVTNNSEFASVAVGVPGVSVVEDGPPRRIPDPEDQILDVAIDGSDVDTPRSEVPE